ncbi:uncharacterized protein si:ch211-221j21.3 [Brienomyrus brachyistius]|uniref:uncharacterized protein si:ch211-221j21.3 n=1 Tax=Brienomyrus brachyistius TaxID=42636 RepID=UPI0020B1AFAB|nr:uncharacterized protein si:ch211-221j21.3 [Brienomyrus brachyistius]
MDCMLASQNKRPLEGGDLEGWNHRGPSKKFCSGLGAGDKAECAGMVDCSMATLEKQGAHGGAAMRFDSGPNAGYTLQAGSSGQCLRCMAGESGHINHILGY